MNKARRSALERVMADRLNGYRILILETREEAQFSRLLAEQGADVLQCPMFTIHDAPDPAPIEAWIRRCIETPFDDLVLMTGEGLRRLMKVARRIGLEQDFIAALGKAAQIRARSQTRPGAARDRAGAAGDDGEADLRRHRRDAVAHRSQRPSRRPAALSGQGSRRPDRRDQGAGRRGRYRAALCLRRAGRRRQHRHRDRRDGAGPHRCDRADQSRARSAA